MANTKITSHVIESGAVHTTHIASGAISAAHLTGITTANITENTNLYYTDSRARSSISVTGGNLSYDSSTGVIQLTDGEIRDALSAGTGVTYSSGQFSIGQAVGTGDTVTFGNITTTGYLRGPSNFTIDPAAYGDDTGTLIIAGNLQVDGTTTTINSTTLTVDDLNITLASGAANAAAANGAGLTVDGASATLTYDSTNDSWDFNKSIHISGSSALSTEFKIGNLTWNQNTSSTSGLLHQYRGSDGYSELQINNTSSSGAITLNIRNDSASVATIANDGGAYFAGNVGIGTSGPSSKLHVRGTASDTMTTANAFAAFDGTGGDGIIIGARSSSPFAAYIQSGFTPNIGTSHHYPLLLNPHGGNVGIGTSSPDSKLHVHGVGTLLSSDSYFVAQIQTDRNDNGSNDDGILQFVNGSSKTVKGEIRFDESTNTFELGHGDNQNHLVIASGGNVGIGADTPKTTLNLAANDSGQGPILTLENTDTSITTNDVLGQIDFYGNDGSTGGTGQKATIKAIALNGSGTSVGLSFGTSAFPNATATERMQLDSSGKLFFYNSDNGSTGGIRGTRFGYSSTYRVLQIGEASGTFTTSLGVDPSGNSSGSFTGYGNELIVRNDFELISPNAANDNWHNDIIKLKDGNVGVGMSPDGANTSAMEKFQVMGRMVIHNSNGNHVWSETIQGTDRGSLHLDPNSGSNDVGAAITWGASDHNNGEVADAGIYVRTDGAYGSKMYISTTDSYAHGSQTAIKIDHGGHVEVTRNNLGVGVNPRHTTQMKLSVKGNIAQHGDGTVSVSSGTADSGINLYTLHNSYNRGSGRLRCFGTENNLNCGYVEYFYVYSYYSPNGTYYVNLKFIDEVFVSNTYGRPRLYLYNSSSYNNNSTNRQNTNQSTTSTNVNILQIGITNVADAYGSFKIVAEPFHWG